MSTLFETEPTVRKSAILSPCRTYRYVLRRVWDEGRPTFTFIGLNPSTADETNDDPTIRRCIGFAKKYLCGGLAMVNLFAFRATEPKDMMKAADPIGPENDEAIVKWAKQADSEPGGFVVCGWGASGTYRNRGQQVLDMIDPLLEVQVSALAVTKGGQPGHPLYLPNASDMVMWHASAKEWR